jgi:hypothetical protein
MSSIDMMNGITHVVQQAAQRMIRFRRLAVQLQSAAKELRSDDFRRLRGAVWPTIAKQTLE